MRRSKHWLPRTLAGVLMIAGAAVIPASPARAETCSTTLPHPDGFGITCLSVGHSTQGEDSDLRTITMTSTAIFQASGGTPTITPLLREIGVRLYLPKHYDPSGATRYRTLYLLNGGGGDYDQWSSSMDLVTGINNSPFNGIVVMPTGGRTGWYTDWAGRTDGYFAPKWETYHFSQLIPWIDANFPTIAGRSGRGIAGLSMGGYGALRYAATHPDVFSVVGAFSPGIELRAKPAQGTVSDTMWEYGAAIGQFDDGRYRVNKYDGNGVIVFDQDEQMRYRLDTLFGPHTTTVVNGKPVYDWPSANPGTLVNQGKYAPYSGKLGLYAGGCRTINDPATGSPVYGDGNRSAPDQCAYNMDTAAGASGTNEPILGTYANAFHQTLTGLGVGHRYCYGTGGHDWTSWAVDLTDFLQYAYGTAPALCPNA